MDEIWSDLSCKGEIWAKRSVLEGGEGKHLGDSMKLFIHPISPMLRLFRFGVSPKKTAKTLQNLQNFHISSPFLISSTTCGWPRKPLPQLFRLTTSGSFCPLTGFMSASCADTMTWQHLVFGAGVRFVGRKVYTRYVQQRHTVDGSEIRPKTAWDVKKPVNNGINYQPQLVSRSSEPSTTVQYTWRFWF